MSMKIAKALTPLSLTTTWQLIPITSPAKSVAIQCRTAVDVLLAHQTNGDYWTLKSGQSLILDTDGSKFASAADSTNQILNGTFTGDAANWTLTSGWAYSSNTLAKSGDGITVASQPMVVISGKLYKVGFTMSGYSVSGLQLRVGGGTLSEVMAADAAFTEFVIGGNSSQLFELVPSANASRFSVDGITVYRVDGAYLLAKVATSTAVLEILALE